MLQQNRTNLIKSALKLSFIILLLTIFQMNTFAQSDRVKDKVSAVTKLALSFRPQIGFNTGFMTYGGDLKKEYYTWRQSNPAIGFQIRNEFNKYFAVRVFANYGHIEGDDAKTGDRDLQKRNLSFKSPITEYGFLTEFSVPISYDCRLSEDDPNRYYPVVPYGFVGIQSFHFNPMAFYQGKWIDLQPLHTEGAENEYKLNQIAIPFGFGLKYSLNSKLSFAFEFGIRKTFTDYLDDVSTNYPDLKLLAVEEGELSAALSYRTDELTGKENTKPFVGQKRGYSDKKDAYLTNMFSIRYSIGK